MQSESRETSTAAAACTAGGQCPSTVNTQQSACRGALIQRSTQSTVPIHQPVMTKRVKPTSSLFTCTIVRHRQAPCPTANGQQVLNVGQPHSESRAVASVSLRHSVVNIVTVLFRLLASL